MLRNLRATLVWRFRRVMPKTWVWKWCRFWTQGFTLDGEIHVLPWNDVIGHTDSSCVCGPTAEVVMCEVHSDTWIFHHHALDGRK